MGARELFCLDYPAIENSVWANFQGFVDSSFLKLEVPTITDPQELYKFVDKVGALW
jgi:hypothetical protein